MDRSAHWVVNTQKHTRVTHIIITIIILPSPLWNGAFCALGRSFHVACFVMSAHDAVANRTQFVGPAFHGETIPWGGTAALTKRGTGTYHLCHGLALCGARGSHLKNKPPKPQKHTPLNPKSKPPKPQKQNPYTLKAKPLNPKNKTPKP